MIVDRSKLAPFMRRISKVHFVGIGGVGMCGIAEVMHTLGYTISGSDLVDSIATQRLKNLGVKIFKGHTAGNVSNVDVVVVTGAVQDDNLEVLSAKKQHIPVIPRAEMLAELMRFSHGIAVAGTHGKTTTTSLITSILKEGGLDPTYVIGGKLNSSASNASLGSSEYLVAEADESDASFLYLQPMIAVVTNVDADHLTAYHDDFDRLREAFVEFLHHLPFYGLAIICFDDVEARKLLARVPRPILTYGFDNKANIKALNVETKGMQTNFDVQLPDRENLLPVTLNLPGEHNVLNALAAIAVGFELGVTDSSIQSALSGFQGIGRRIQLAGTVTTKAGRVTLVDDYAHHPTEVRVTLDAVRKSWPGKRLVVVFQPHRYTRTRDLFDDFTSVLSECDVLLLSEVYAAGEDFIAGADSRSLSAAIRTRGKVNPIFVEDLEKLDESLLAVIEDDDLILTLGAGDIGRIAAALPEKLKEAA